MFILIVFEMYVQLVFRSLKPMCRNFDCILKLFYNKYFEGYFIIF